MRTFYFEESQNLVCFAELLLQAFWKPDITYSQAIEE